MSRRFSRHHALTGPANLRFYGRSYGRTGARLAARVRQAGGMADLVGREGGRTRDLSGGWRQRLALGAAVLHRPELVFLDEPTAGVDPISRRAFWRLLYSLAADGIAVFVTTPYRDGAERCHRLAFIQRRALTAAGTPAESNMDGRQAQHPDLAPAGPAGGTCQQPGIPPARRLPGGAARRRGWGPTIRAARPGFRPSRRNSPPVRRWR